MSTKREAELALTMIAAKAELAATKLRSGGMWSGELTDATREIRSQLATVESYSRSTESGSR